MTSSPGGGRKGEFWCLGGVRTENRKGEKDEMTGQLDKIMQYTSVTILLAMYK